MLSSSLYHTVLLALAIIGVQAVTAASPRASVAPESYALRDINDDIAKIYNYVVTYIRHANVAAACDIA